ncbi:MAG: lysylphosphatidylglycerol synthase domain-containing protein, partial [Candidatus Pacebacteria bacterium]|nr:lysylphosphatidylglycerol synthase domain-containing protein [Candidatus Paceibacterota bacterium]
MNLEEAIIDKNKALKVVITMVVILLLIIFFVRNFESFRQIRIYNFWLLFPLIISFVLFLVTNGIVLKELLLPFKIELSIKEWFGLSVITTAGNLLTPLQGGMVTRALYLKSKHDFSYTNFLSALSGIYIIVFWVNSFVALIAMLLIGHYYSVFNWLVFVTFLIIFLGLSFIIVISPKIKKTFKLEILNKAVRVVNGWLVIKNSKKTILAVTIISLINVFLMSVSSFLEFRVIGVEISFLKALFISIVSTLSLFVSLTPGSLGIKEAFVAFTSGVVGISSANA